MFVPQVGGFRACRSVSVSVFPRKWNEESPFCNESLAVQSGIELRVAGREPRAAKFDQRGAGDAPFREVSKPLEHCAIGELIRIRNELLVIAVGTLQICIEAVRDLLNASADCWVIEHVNDRAVNIGDRHFGFVTPNWFEPENLIRS
jgi:hypothetical protein